MPLSSAYPHTPDMLERVTFAHLDTSVTQGCLRCGRSSQDRVLSALVDVHRQWRRAT